MSGAGCGAPGGPRDLPRPVTAAAGGGVLLYLGFAPRTLWWLALPAFGLLGATVHGRRARAGFGYGALFGLGFLLPLLRWTGIYVGPVPWLALSAAEAVFVGAAGAGMAAVSRLRGAPAVGGGGVGRRGGAAGARARSAASRGGASRSASPTARCSPVAAVGGAPLLSFVTVPGRPRAGRGRAGAWPGGEVRAAVGPRWSRSSRWRPAAGRAAPARRLDAGAHRDDRGRAGQRAAARPGLQRPAPGGARQPRAGHRAARRGRRRRPLARARTWCSGRRTPPTSTRCATPTPRALIDRAARAVGVPILVGTVLATARRRTRRELGARLGPGDRAGRQLRQAAPGAVRGVPAAAAVLPAAVQVRRPGQRDFVPGDRPGGGRRRRRRRRDLLRDRVRRPGRRQRRRRRAGARRCRPTTRRSAAATRPTSSWRCRRLRAVEHGRPCSWSPRRAGSARSSPRTAPCRPLSTSSPRTCWSRTPSAGRHYARWTRGRRPRVGDGRDRARGTGAGGAGGAATNGRTARDQSVLVTKENG